MTQPRSHVDEGDLNSDGSELPYWQVNVPESDFEANCPEYLQNLSQKDIGILKTKNADYHILSWLEVQNIVAQQDMERFQRVPTELRRYLKYIWEIKKSHGSIINFIAQERLHWKLPLVPKDSPFKNLEDDLHILCNDWPYGIDQRIVHLVVWTKFPLSDDFSPDTGSDNLVNSSMIQNRSKETSSFNAINDFIDQAFVRHLGKEKVIWFMNPRKLKSVHAIEHFHVMLFDPDPGFVRQVTSGDVAIRDRIQY